MGYYTKFSMKAIDLKPGKDRPTLDEAFFNSLQLYGSEAGEELWISQGDGFSFCDDEIKWYEHDLEMIAVSKKNKDIVFILDGDGEETGDVWRKFYLNGKKFEWQLVVKRPEFNDVILSSLKKSK